MKKLFVSVLCVFMLIPMVVGCAATSVAPTEAPTTPEEAPADAITISYGHGFNPGSPQAMAADEFKARVEEESQGRIVVDVYPAGQLGSAQEMFESVQMGTQEIALLPTARISGFCPQLQVFDLPFLFPDRETAYSIFDGEVGQTLLDTMDDSGVKGLAIYEDGFKHFTCNSKIETLEDFKGKKFRTMESPIIMEEFKALGANPVPVDFSELYNALQQKTVDGQENPLATIDSVKIYEVQDYMLYSSHAYLGHVLIVGKDWFEGLDADAQQIILHNARDVGVWERDLVMTNEALYLENVKNGGCTVIELSDAERTKMRDAMAPVYTVAKDVVGEQLLNLVVDAAQK